VKNLKLAIYSRKSVYTGKGESIENQIEMCRQYIAANIGGADDITVFEDEGFSGKNMDRPQFQKMLKEIRLRTFEYVVCYRLDRISRSVGDFATLIEELNKLEINFVCIKEKFDTSSPMGKAMMYIASVFSQLERETLAERVRDNMFMLARTGRWLGGTPPTGFASDKTEKVDVDGKKKTAFKLRFEPAEIETVKVIFQKFLELHKISAVYKHLIDVGIKSRNGKLFSQIGIKSILENPVYCIADKEVRDYFISHDSDVCFREEACSDEWGLLSYNKRDYKKQNVPRHGKSEWIIAIGKHKGIISGKQWVAVQGILEANKPTGAKTNAYNDYSLLSGTILCGKCGRRMFATLRKNKGTDGLFDYICEGKLRGGKKLCDCQNLNGKQTDDMVCDYLLQYTDAGSSIYKLLEKFRRNLQTQENADPLAELSVRISRCNSEMDNLIHSLSQPDVGQALMRRVNARVDELSEEMERLNKEKERLQDDLSFITDKAVQLDIIANALSSLKTYFKEMSVPEKRTLIKLLVQKIEWDGENLHIFIYGE
jgi:site-specific DNA recombinase